MLLTLGCLMLAGPSSSAQSKITTLGIQFKPIFPVEFLGTGKQTIVDSTVHYDLLLTGGYNFGMVIRKGFTELLSLETGICYVKRKYHIEVSENGFSESSDFRIIGYEIPASLLVYIRLGEQVFMNASLGVSADMYASNVRSFGTYHETFTVRRNIFQAALLANLGWEYRTAKSGYFYLGASLHRPFDYELVTRMEYERNNTFSEVFEPVSGSYLTFDVRYFFHEVAGKKKKM